MKRKQWQRRLLCCFLAVAVLLGGLLCCLPVHAGAIVPLSFVQSALASYVTSSGYKLYNDQGTGSDILGSLGELYDDFVTVNNKTIQGSVATLAWLANSPLIYQDNSGQIVISQVAANIMQDFAEWIETEYDVPVGSDTPTEIVQSSGGTWGNDSGVSCLRIVPSKTARVSSTTVYYDLSIGTVLYGSDTFPLYAGISFDSPFFVTIYGSTLFIGVPTPASGRGFRFAMNGSSPIPFGNTSFNSYGWAGITFDSSNSFNIPISSVSPDSFYVSEFVSSGGVAALGATLAQAVADVVGQAKEDDAVVIGVGASAGATAQDIADMVAQGVKAQTLDPSVSIVAEAVIDTPVQPYPDVDGLGLPTLGAALVSRFPFCVPWDFVDTLKILNAEPTPPVFDVTLIPASVAARWGVSGDYTLHVDLTDPDYAKLFLALRWGTLVGFCIGLALLTKRLIWTA